MWTEASTKRQIVAELKEKDDEKGTVTLRLKPPKVGKPGKIVTLPVSRLVKEDQEYVKNWIEQIPDIDKLTVRVVGSGRNKGKRVEVDVKAGRTDVVVSGGCDVSCHHQRLHKSVKAGERGLFQLEVHDKYTFTLTDKSGGELDKETALRKTGKTDSR